MTIYRDEGIDDPASANWGGYGLAMIAEERTIDLPAGESRIVFQGVADGALPPSASLQGVPGRIVEQNFDYEVLSPGALARHAVGGTVHVVRTNARTGKPITEDAVLRSGPNGLVLDFGGRIEAFQCSGGYERLIYDNLPPDLSGKAQLSTRVRVARAGRYKVRLSYLTVGLAWKASYVARVTPDGSGLDLTGWITLANHGDTTFANAPTSVVAGRLARQAVALTRPIVAHRAAACWPTGNSHHPRGEQLWVMQAEPVADELREVTMAGSMMARSVMAPIAMPAPPPPPPPPPVQSDLGDYKLYTLGEPTTVAARQTKQVAFLHQADVKFDRVYVYKISAWLNRSAAGPSPAPTVTTLRLENKPQNGLGRALPAGHVSVRQAQAAADGREMFIGEPDLRDVPVGEPFELEVGAASDVTVSWRVASLTPFTRNGRRGTVAAVEVTATNAKGEPVTTEVRLQGSGAAGFKVTAESAPHGTKAGDPVWRLALPANGETTLTYSFERLDY